MRLVTAREQYELLAPWRTASDDDYRMRHRPPEADYGASMDNPGDMFPDIHTMGHIYHTHWPEGADRESMSAIKKSKDNPNAMVKIYRALPSRAKQPDGTFPMNTGDWVTPSLAYAHQHGQSNIEHIEPYSVISHMAPAGSLHTEGNSIHEWAYNGEPAKVGEVR
ncbi:ParB C-terminal domain [Mycobacterium phage Phabba]|uniref:Uncharacterized protein n=1 Tax=Mycobacterium phage Phabba TaxID=2027899 RepID=A0A249XSH0_9CAUD|nr:ParB C-terminal domain [Mycobacterium phage Phabba]ASZ74692.1 hypothetical protein SEA_PHABBA_123 [Mycobacterium phage Phabba]